MAMQITVKKHAACDECRGRKLKCSGNQPECDRCRKDQAKCIYSQQKRMGRPRKSISQSLAATAYVGGPYSPPEPALPQATNNSQHEQYSEQPWILPSHSSIYGLDWADPQENNNTDSFLDGQFGFGNTHPPVPLAPISGHLSVAQSLELQLSPTMFISSSPQGPTDFERPSSSFTSHSYTLEQSPHLPTAPVSLASSSRSESTPMSNPLGITSVGSNCDCIFSFLLLITSFRAHLTKSPIPFQTAIATSRTAIATATYSLTCPSCLTHKVTLECISDMFFGALLPMLCSFYTISIGSIDAVTGHQTVQIEGNETGIGIEEWRAMARNAMMQEAVGVSFLVRELGKLSAEKHSIIGGAFRSAADALWEPLYSRLIEVTERNSLGQMFAENIGMC